MKKEKIAPILAMLFNVFLIVAFYGTPLAQSQTLEDFRNSRFSEVQKKAMDCLVKDYDSIPDSDFFETGNHYRMWKHLEQYGNCSNEAWNDDAKKACVEMMIFYPKTLESKEGLIAYQKIVDDLGGNPRAVIAAKAIFFKDPSYCDAIPKEEYKLSHFRCRAFSSAGGVNECLENFAEGDPERLACADVSLFFDAMRAGNANACTKISATDLKLRCEAFVTNSETSADKMKRNYMNEECMREYGLPLAVTGVLDPEALQKAAADCDTISEEQVAARKACKEFFGDVTSAATYCDKIPPQGELRNTTQQKECKDLVAEAAAFLKSSSPK